ncbi:MAG: methylenetetrahydrofolate reductase C-terminal domain-containing protein, partial [Desulfobulbaceae bacterium]|nr:methylenetetrahydrofolate reductase C-terminal domain-containing protein [Desulfobulbaceae bacterium]
YMLNGPCGGSRDGWCEVYPGKRLCIYVSTYERLASSSCQEEFKNGFVPPRNWLLNNSSSWLNFYLGLDNRKNKPVGNYSG